MTIASFTKVPGAPHLAAMVLGACATAACGTSYQTVPRQPFYSTRDELGAIQSIAMPSPYGGELGMGSPSLRPIADEVARQLRARFTVNEVPDIGDLVDPFLVFRSPDGRELHTTLLDLLSQAGGLPAAVAGRICGGVNNAIFLAVVFEGAGRVEASSTTTAMWGGSEEQWQRGDFPTLTLMGVLLDCEGAIGWAEAIHLGYTRAPTVETGITMGEGIVTSAASPYDLVNPASNSQIPVLIASMLSSLLRAENPIPNDWLIE